MLYNKKHYNYLILNMFYIFLLQPQILLFYLKILFIFFLLIKYNILLLKGVVK